MTQPLFINVNQDFIRRIRTEAGPEALLTPSMIQGLRWISNPDLPISGVYLNPNDTNYSALRFLEILLLQRPATPVFIIHDEGDHTSPSYRMLLKSNHVRGAFKGSESFGEFLKPIQTHPQCSLHLVRERKTQRSTHAGFIAVPIIDFVSSATYPFDAFVEDKLKNTDLHLLAAAGSAVDTEYLTRALEKSPWIYVSEKDIQNVRESLKDTQAHYMNLHAFPTTWKTAEVLYNAKVLLNEMRKSGLSDTLVEHTHFMLTDVFHLVSQIDQETKLRTFIDQAKNCDRNIACVTLSILMCKSLRFEKNAIVEILGLASLFQDISLMNSPYGDLYDVKPHEMSPTALAYYHEHPFLSADLVAQHTSIPDVTVQVMRQHHERKDRTGFPRRIGGMQLHPMAEVLSLINAYLDHSGDPSTMETDIFAHYSDRVVGAFKNLQGIIEKAKAA